MNMNPIVIDGSSAPPVLSPKDQAKAALSEQIERAIPPDLGGFKKSHKIYVVKRKQLKDTTGENIIVSPILVYMSP